MIGISHRYLTQELPGIGGRIRAQLDDFVVEEQPLYSPCGSGEHVYFCVEKRDLSTLPLVETSEAIDSGALRMEGREGPVSWEGQPQVMPVQPALNQYFVRPGYIEAVAAAREKFRFRLA